MTAAIAAEIPALALVNAAGELERSTDAFRTRFGPAVEALEQEPRLDRVLSGQLEHSVPPFEGRPALTVYRFVIRDTSEEPVAVCGVATPIAEAEVARSECARLMQIERWSRLDARAIRAEVLRDWGIVPLTEGPR